MSLKYSSSTIQVVQRIPLTIQTRRCARCKIEKPLGEFRSHRKACYCKSCEAFYNKDWHSKNPERVRYLKKRWNSNNLIRNWCHSSIRQHRLSGYLVQFDIDWLEVFAKDNAICQICGVAVKYGGGKVSAVSATLDRVENKNILDKDNIAIICHLCNRTKGPRTLKEFIDYCKIIVEKAKGGLF